MNDNPLVKYGGTILGDIATVFGIPAGTGIEAMRDFISRRGQAAREILFQELKAGNISEFEAANDDEALSIIHRYALAARDGVARRNLRLLARVMVGLARRDKLYSDEFNKYADVLNRLSRDQIFVLGTYYPIYKNELKITSDNNVARDTAWKKLVKKLVPTDFPTEEHLQVIINQCASNGLLLAGSAYSGLVYDFSPLMDEIEGLVDFQGALRREDEATQQ